MTTNFAQRHGHRASTTCLKIRYVCLLDICVLARLFPIENRETFPAKLIFHRSGFSVDFYIAPLLVVQQKKTRPRLYRGTTVMRLVLCHVSRGGQL